VSPGIYAVQVRKEGFTTYQVSDLQIEVGQAAALDITLHLGETRTVVTVSSADTEALDTTSNVIGTVVDSAQVQGLPLNAAISCNWRCWQEEPGDVSPASSVTCPMWALRTGPSFCPERCLTQWAISWTAYRSAA